MPGIYHECYPHSCPLARLNFRYLRVTLNVEDLELPILLPPLSLLVLFWYHSTENLACAVLDGTDEKKRPKCSSF